MRITLLLHLFVLLSQSLYGQTTYSTTNKRAIRAYIAGREARVDRDFEEAIKQFAKAIKRDDTFWEAHLSLGEAYEVMFDTAQAVVHWEKAVEYNQESRRMARTLFKLGSYYLRKGELDQAADRFTRFMDLDANLPKLIKKAQRSLRSIAFIREAKANPVPFNPEELPDEINAFALQYFPIVTVKGDQFIFTARPTPNVGEDEDIYVSTREAGGWSLPASISDNINTPNLNEGTCTISADGRLLIFTSCERGDVIGSCDLYMSQKTGSTWSTPINLGSRVNSTYWESQPSLSADGRTLYFVSRRRGGYGKSDIWVSKMQADGEWGYPQNLGPEINTPEDDVSPFIHVNGQSLYFSSKGHIGMGGYDLFHAKLSRNGWSTPKNLGYPINDEQDQVSLFITSNGKRAFFNREKRKEGHLYTSKLYSFELPDDAMVAVPSTYVFGKVYDAETKLPLGSWVDLMDLDADSVLGRVRSDPITGEYTMVLNEGAEYGLFTQAKHYLYDSRSFNYVGKEGVAPVEIDIYLEPLRHGKTIVMNNVFFDTDSYELRERSKTELNRAAKLILANPRIRVEIAGHTDDVGGDAYNQTLSTNRAHSVYQYLVRMGVPKKRLRFVGHGETRPRVDNSSEGNRQLNRRIEFVIYR